MCSQKYPSSVLRKNENGFTKKHFRNRFARQGGSIEHKRACRPHHAKKCIAMSRNATRAIFDSMKTERFQKSHEHGVVRGEFDESGQFNAAIWIGIGRNIKPKQSRIAHEFLPGEFQINRQPRNIALKIRLDFCAICSNTISCRSAESIAELVAGISMPWRISVVVGRVCADAIDAMQKANRSAANRLIEARILQAAWRENAARLFHLPPCSPIMEYGGALREVAMPAVIQCPTCQKEYRWKPELAGKRVKCKCGTVIAVPTAEPAPEANDLYDLADDGPASPQHGIADLQAAVAAAPVAVDEGNQFRCPYCGENIEAGSAMCVYCGSELAPAPRPPPSACCPARCSQRRLSPIAR